MSFLYFLDHWWNFPFLVVLALVILFALLQVVGLFGHDADHGGGDLHVDHGGGDHGGGDLHVDHGGGELHFDHGGDAHLDVDHGGHADLGHHALDAQPGALAEALAAFGVGRVPLSILIITFLLGVGFAGLVFNRLIYGIFGRSYPGYMFALALVVATIIGLVVLGIFARTLGRLVDMSGAPALAKKDLAGRLGVVASPTIDDNFGEVRVHDPDGNEVLVHGRIQAGEPVLTQGQRVVLVDFDPDTDMFWVAASPEVDAT